MRNREFNLKPSICYLLLLNLFVIGSLAVALTIPADWRIRLLLFVAVAVYGGQLIWCYGLLKGRNAILSITALPDKRWLIRTKVESVEASLKGDSTVTHLVSILRFQIAGRYFPLSCTLFCDSLAADRYRELRVEILHG